MLVFTGVCGNRNSVFCYADDYFSCVLFGADDRNIYMPTFTPEHVSSCGCFACAKSLRQMALACDFVTLKEGPNASLRVDGCHEPSLSIRLPFGHVAECCSSGSMN